MKKDNLEKPSMPYEHSTIENVDMAMYNWVNETLNLYANTNEGWKKVPVIWVSGERSWQIKHNRDLRDSNNMFILPSITVERTGISKDPNKKGKYWGNVYPAMDEKGGSIAIHRVVNQEKTSGFAKADNKRLTGQPNFKRENKKVVYRTKFIPMPVYVTMTYVIDIKTEYQQQINELIQPFVTYSGGLNYFMIKHNKHKYESFMDTNIQIKNNINDLQQNERLYNTQITVNVLAHLLGSLDNDNRPKIIERENAVEIKIPKEYVIIDQPEITAPFPLEDGITDKAPIYIRTSDGDYILIG